MTPEKLETISNLLRKKEMLLYHISELQRSVDVSTYRADTKLSAMLNKIKTLFLYKGDVCDREDEEEMMKAITSVINRKIEKIETEIAQIELQLIEE